MFFTCLFHSAWFVVNLKTFFNGNFPLSRTICPISKQVKFPPMYIYINDTSIKHNDWSVFNRAGRKTKTHSRHSGQSQGTKRIQATNQNKNLLEVHAADSNRLVYSKPNQKRIVFDTQEKTTPWSRHQHVVTVTEFRGQKYFYMYPSSFSVY